MCDPTKGNETITKRADKNEDKLKKPNQDK